MCVLLADAGYWDEHHVAYLEERGIDPYIATKRLLGYEISSGEGSRLFEDCAARWAPMIDPWAAPAISDAPRYGKPVPIRPRLGQRLGQNRCYRKATQTLQILHRDDDFAGSVVQCLNNVIQVMIADLGAKLAGLLKELFKGSRGLL